jgi:hypothetical protein
MKNNLLCILLIILFLPVVADAQNSKTKKDPVGKWLFEAPYAPEGYTAGTIEVGYAEKTYSASMAFKGNESKLTGDRIKFENDTLFFNVFVEGQDVRVSLTLTDETKMSGKAVYSEGVVPLVLTREKKKE